jgi:arabinan endo-1,5-alpha-L-arabinosidase
MALSYKNDEQQDERLNPGAQDIRQREDEAIPGYARKGDGLDDHPISAGVADGVDPIDDINRREADFNYVPGTIPSLDKKKRRARVWVRRALPLGITSIIFGGAGLGLFYLSPGLLLVQIKEVFTNYSADASRAAPMRYQKLMNYTLGNKKVDKVCAKKPSGVKCRVGTFSDTQIRDYERAGFKLNGVKVEENGRTIVKTVQFPDDENGKPGRIVKTGRQYQRELRRSVRSSSLALRAYNSATQVFNGSRFSKNVLAQHFNADKSKVTLDGDTDEERNEDLTKRVGGDLTKEERATEFRDRYGSRISDAGNRSVKGLAKFTGPVAAGCATYNVARVSLTAAKLANVARFVTFGLLFVKVADQIKDGGNVDPGTVAALGTILTSYASSGPSKGLTATDSQGYKIAAYGGERQLSSFTKRFLLGNNQKLIALQNSVNYINDHLGKKNVRAACRSASDPKLATAMLAVICGGEIVGGGAGGSVIPVAGTIAGGVLGAVACAAQEIGIAIAGSKLVSLIVSLALPHVIDSLVDTKLTSNISGVDAGNAIAVGMGVMLNTASLSRGLAPSTKSQATHFLAATADSQSENERIAAYDAKNEPFNAYNQYSFLGSLIRKSGILSMNFSSLSSGLTSLGTILQTSFTAPTTSYAVGSMPVNITSADLSHCPDEGLREIGVDCDLMGEPKYVLSDKELGMGVADNLDFMTGTNSEGSYVDEDGNPTSDKYEKWVKYCTEQREDLMGSSSLAIEDKDYDWSTGKNCGPKATAVSQTELANFRVYYNTLAEKEDGDAESTSQTTTGGGSEFVISTLNVQGANHNEKNYTARMDGSIASLQSGNTDIAGLQELQDVQRTYLMKKLGSTFAIWPDKPMYGADDAHASEDSIIYNSTKFEYVDGGTMPGLKYFHGSNLKAPWVKLKDKNTTQEFYVLNTHDPTDQKGTAGGPFGRDAQSRKENAEAHVTFINSLKSEGLPIFFTGDFNSGYSLRRGTRNDTYQNKSENLTYCIMTAGGMKDAFDVESNDRPAKCPNPGNDNAVDHIYFTPEVQLVGYSKDTKRGVGGNGSDSHDTHFAHVKIAGGESSNAGGGTPVPYTNPVINQNVPDPTVFKDDNGTYQLYATGGTASDPFQHFTSKDMVHWTKGGRVLEAGSVPGWLADERWAPDITKTGDHFTLTFSGSPNDCVGHRRIGYATAPTAAGPFSYRGELVNNSSDGCGYDIDPKLISTDQGLVLYYGSGGSISAVKITMASNGSLKQDGYRKPVIIRGGSESTLVEGAWVWQHAGWYYLSYSSGQYATTSGSNEYRVNIARSKDPMGGFEKMNTPLLRGQGAFRATGHNSVTTDNAANDWIIYHAQHGGKRVLMIDPITYTNDWPVVNDGFPSSGSKNGPATGGGA